VIAASLLCLCTASAVLASLRARYTVPRWHEYKQEIIIAEYGPGSVPATIDSGWIKDTVIAADTLMDEFDTLITVDTTIRVADSVIAPGSEYGEEKLLREWWEALEAGAWDSYDEQTGFDGVSADEHGSIVTPDWVADGKPIVDKTFWVDSLGETWHGGTYVADNIADTGAALGGFFIMFFGQITIPETGDYTFVSSGRYEGTRIWIDLNDDGVFEDDLTECNADGDIERDSVPAHLEYWSISKRGTRVWEVENLQAGSYRFRAHFWMWGAQSANSSVAWFTPDMDPATDTAVVIPASAFGQRKQYGVPVAKVESIALDGVVLDAHVSTQVCQQQTVTLVGRLLRAPEGATPTYKWDLEDTVITTTADTIHYVYQTAGEKEFRLYVEYGGEFPTREVSGRYRITYSDDCTSVARPRHAARAGRAVSLSGTRLTVGPGRGERTVVRVFAANGRTVFARSIAANAASTVLDLAAQPLASGSYVVRVELRGTSIHNGMLLIP
jgi:hypothetical protein